MNTIEFCISQSLSSAYGWTQRGRVMQGSYIVRDIFILSGLDKTQTAKQIVYVVINTIKILSDIVKYLSMYLKLMITHQLYNNLTFKNRFALMVRIVYPQSLKCH